MPPPPPSPPPHTHSPEQHRADLQRGAPLVLENIEADAAQLVDIRVVDLCEEPHLWPQRRQQEQQPAGSQQTAVSSRTMHTGQVAPLCTITYFYEESKPATPCDPTFGAAMG